MDISLHQKRVATAVGLAAIPALALVFQGWVLFVVLALFCTFTLWEFYDMFSPLPGVGTVKSLGAVFTFLLLGAYAADAPQHMLMIFVAAFWAAAILFLVRFTRDATASFKPGMVLLAGLVYIPLNLHFFLSFSRHEILLVIGAAAISDTAAFYSGTLWGKKKIWPKVSPKKSWVGSLGGLTACMLATTGFGMAFGLGAPWQWLLLGAALNVAAQMGDFFESALKRSLHIKDSSSILPGHGGLLDRIDSLLLVVPTYGLIRTVHAFF
ncbi:MAG: phosphatidate cytidylyltransferase [Pseudodesulfovibrio sp.]|uniref:Phosphatidate cytidylyltransferase n=1 Tax=Pseudodesulfovibrio aespoeensis (strain ATCC 700646 / DSM 10631 / Aspo-2) TaxID=643562 RepID=E6VSU7_PSEA9|nr:MULTISPECIES: phosphatidate cytidylyltransferase [Pseudodesulfovibrio]MBU4190748.1 phosphatidate cytidylyltransferase [Pseudomonadota bacterium]ADU63191.1 phosphatidate cytidylyltransferase [Pseudodesulfovibrio aespoeensis Aspo-2]MBU4243255.1 phosphatidate cytidylyltransferase [Pseudomonadota bacterium]MBU4379140.1 phosphatidate cytidylyltransferase [Pseudomonadota bacterium]MBU4475088.1 phosphatidate cytidylyltransferase [Pseudomonadota bacterium]